MPNYILLERIELNASAASVTFSNIPQSGYTDLKIVHSIRQSRSDVTSTTQIKFNGSSSNLSCRYIQGYGSGVISSSSGSYIFNDSPANSSTANTFGNGEIYISNYTGSTNKSVSWDAVTENNATAANAYLVAGLWSNTAAITSIELSSLSSDNFMQYSTFSLYGLAALGTTPVIAPKASGGNIIDFDGTYWIHTFTTTGAFVPQQGLTCDYLVVAGGGGGGADENGNQGGGGGGAGAMLTGSTSVSTTSYTVTVGAGGAGSLTIGGTQGSNSVFSSITSTGGGAGGWNTENGGNGGSGGGAGGYGSGTGGTATTGGNAGGAAASGRAGGGGGASAAGGTGSTAYGGNGLASSISGTSVTYAGGGGAGATNTANVGGTGGGGTGARSSGLRASAGTINLGGGGGGGNWYTVSDPDQSAAGGSGIVIIRYLA